MTESLRAMPIRLRSLPLAPLLTAIPAFVVLFGFGMVAPDVLTTGNLWNIATQTSYLAIFTLGQTIVLLTAGLDLSIGMAVSYTSVVAALALVNVAAPGLAILAYLAAGVGLGLVIGAVNGFFVAIVGINPFIVTLGTYNILFALSSTVTGGFPVSGFPPLASQILVDASVLGIPIPIVISAIVIAVVGFLLRRTVFGRSLYLIGSNPSMATAAGIRVRLHTLGAYLLCSGLGTFGGLLLSARAGSGEPNIGGSLALQTVAAAVIGGARLRGGKGGVLSALLGAFFITVLSNGMNLARIDGYIQQLCIGAIIILALLAEQISQNAERSS
jgi:ribose transport system permease protein